MAIGNQPPVLIVEDDVQTRRTLSTIVSCSNYKALEAEDGIEALRVVKASKPHVVISDLQMPLMDGYSLLRVLAEYFPEIGTIALSGAFDQWPPRPAPVAADAFFAKGSYSMNSLLSCVDDLARLFPLRPSRQASVLSVAWRPQALAEPIWIACRNCLHCFAWPPAKSLLLGIHEARCPSCSADLQFRSPESGATGLPVPYVEEDRRRSLKG